MDSSENNTSDFDKKIIDNDIDDFIVKKSESLSSEKVVINSNNSLDKPSILQVQPNKNLQPQNIQNEKALIHQDKFQESIPDMVKFTLSQNRKKAEIILNPKELGEVSIDVQSQENGNYKVTIVTQSASAAELFLKNQHLLEKSFIEQGAQNSQLSFEFKQQEHSQQSQDNYNSEFSMAGKESREQEETRQTLPREVDDRILSIRI